ncbi:hypothetical protein BDV34DRAFT_161002 [Aspergillus parasiticus]|uniref:Uncharacterized protein n=1 Tax=Aspergillus parasiticus TaxID=5067 RepID=A0A5N6DA31_ASPPA|nr:hypothetical protein BDV34DRAFT_161002 [Aspergillus parasiticus]
MEKPTFFVLNKPLPMSEGGGLLGLCVVDPFRPLDIAAPQGVEKLAKEYYIEPVGAQKLQILLKAASEKSIFGRLQSLLEVAAAKGWKKKLDIKATSVVTHGLKLHDELFQKILEDDDMVKQITGKFKYSKHGMMQWRDALYMVVGYKTVTESAQTTEVSEHESRKAKAQLPAKEIANAFAPGVVPPGFDMNPELGEEAKEEGENKQSSKTASEQIFAVEYREITKPFFASKAGFKPKLGNVKHGSWGNAVMGQEALEGLNLYHGEGRSDVEKFESEGWSMVLEKTGALPTENSDPTFSQNAQA